MTAEQATVVIPTRNRLAFLRESVASVMGQTMSDWRLLVVDDASDDGTSRWVQELNDDRVRSIRSEQHMERSAARNRGLSECETALVLFLDDDDLLVPGSLARLGDALRGTPNAVAAIGGCVYFDREGHEVTAPHPGRRVVRRVWLESVFGWVATTGRTLFRAQALRDVGGFAEDLVMGEDRELWLRLSRCGEAVLIPDIVERHRIHEGQWRPAAAEELEASITERALATLAPRERDTGRRVAEFRRRYDDAYTALNASHHREALRLFATMRSAPPALVLSPLTRRGIFRGFARALGGAVLGPRGLAAVRSLRSLARGRLGGHGERWDVPAPKRVGPGGE